MQTSVHARRTAQMGEGAKVPARSAGEIDAIRDFHQHADAHLLALFRGLGWDARIADAPVAA